MKSYTTTVDGESDHDRAARDICLEIGDAVDTAIDEAGHPVTVSVTVEVNDD